MRKTIPIVPVDPNETVWLYEAQQKIYPRSVSGRFARWRIALVVLTQLVFYGLPWLEWGGRQAVLFDLDARRFYIFNLVLYPQDFIYLTGLLVISALALFLFTTVAGRLWCGYACPQTVYTEIFLWLEKLTEGDRSARMRRDAGPWNADKLWRKGAKQTLWISVALWTGFTFVSYFTPIHVLRAELANFQLGSWEVFWILFYGFATYGNAGYMREQVCKYMCPYARFQSAMFDRDTLIVAYDAGRGDPRGGRSRSADPAALGLGACIDCTLCVQVCPTGIDIRDGLQADCIGCGACIDVCDTVMDKMGYARGLVRYSTQNAVEKHWTARQILAHLVRPRVLVYSAILGAIVVALLASLMLRSPFKVDVVRDRATLARIVAGGKIENVYRLQLMNASDDTQQLQVTATGLPGLALDAPLRLELAPAEARWVVVRLQLPYEAAASGVHPIKFEIASAQGNHLLEKSVFMVPR